MPSPHYPPIGSADIAAANAGCGIFINPPVDSAHAAANDPFMLLSSVLNSKDATPSTSSFSTATPMPSKRASPLPNPADTPANNHRRRLALLLNSLLRDLPAQIDIGLWDGDAIRCGNATTHQPRIRLQLNTPRALRALLRADNPLHLAQAYFNGDLDITGDLYAVLGLKDHLINLSPSLSQRLAGLVELIHCTLLPGIDASAPVSSEPVRRHNRAANQRAIAYHYDVSNDFYALWLDPDMVYSCAYFHSPHDTLAQAQQQKMDHICRKLLLKPGNRLLDVGCGWGALALHAAKHYGVQVHGITLSRQQFDYSTAKVRELKLQGQVQFDLCDYRDLDGQNRYDRICSVGMFEHVGLDNLPLYFSILHRLLKDDGLMLNHGITHDESGWNDNYSTRLINRHVFPDGQLDRISNVLRTMEHCGLHITDVENLRPHYALTLRHWVDRLQTQHDRAVELTSEAHWRIWCLYMAASALEFEKGSLAVHQVIAHKQQCIPDGLPLTRAHLYHPEFFTQPTRSHS